MIFLICVWAFLIQQETPFKASDEFDVSLDYQFKPYKEVETKSFDYNEKPKPKGSQLYLLVAVKLKKLSSDEVKVRVNSNLENSMINKKAEAGLTLKIDFGFIEDVKSGRTANDYNVLLISQDKIESSRIHLFIDKDGTFLVNGQKRGKF